MPSIEAVRGGTKGLSSPARASRTRPAKMPPHALRLNTYAELAAYVRAFAEGHLQLLLLFGPPGVYSN